MSVQTPGRQLYLAVLGSALLGAASVGYAGVLSTGDAMDSALFRDLPGTAITGTTARESLVPVPVQQLIAPPPATRELFRFGMVSTLPPDAGTLNLEAIELQPVRSRYDGLMLAIAPRRRDW